MLSGYLINGWKSDGKFEGTILHQSDCFSRRRSSINSKITLLDIQKGKELYIEAIRECDAENKEACPELSEGLTLVQYLRLVKYSCNRGSIWEQPSNHVLLTLSRVVDDGDDHNHYDDKAIGLKFWILKKKGTSSKVVMYLKQQVIDVQSKEF